MAGLAVDHLDAVDIDLACADPRDTGHRRGLLFVGPVALCGGTGNLGCGSRAAGRSLSASKLTDPVAGGPNRYRRAGRRRAPGPHPGYPMTVRGPSLTVGGSKSSKCAAATSSLSA